MRGIRAWPAIISLVLSFIAMATATPRSAWGATQAAVYSFELGPANTAVAPTAADMAGSGDWIKGRGSGTFTPATGAVKASGKFTHYNADGTVHCSGTWNATSLDDSIDYGANADGDEGGVITMTTSHTCNTMGMTMTGIQMTVTSSINEPSGTVEGTTVGPFTDKPGGGVTIQLQ